MKSQYTILVCGSNGQLGNAIQAESINSVHRFIFTDFEELDISSEESIEENIRNHKPHIIVNCAAYTAVDMAEEEQDRAEQINTRAVKLLADICYNHQIFLIHISTDYVFDGRSYKPYTESDATNPLSVYGYTKLQGEQFIILSGCNGIIIRTSWLYSAYGNNFVKTILRHASNKSELNVVFDQIGTPTNANDLANAILTIADKHITMEQITTYHYSNEGVCSWYDFAKNIVELAKLKCQINPILSIDFPTKAQRPFYSVMDKTQIKTDLRIKIPHWTNSLKKCLQEINGNKHSK